MKSLITKILSVALVALLAGCSFGPKNEKQAFIDATIEATCTIFQADDIFDPALEDQAREIYAKYGFDTDNEEDIQAIADKYSEDSEVQAAILDGISGCSADFFGELDEAGSLEDTDAEEGDDAEVSEEATGDDDEAGAEDQSAEDQGAEAEATEE